jgi:hypothetical protein
MLPPFFRPGLPARRHYMSTTPEPDLNLDLHFLPAWAKASPQENRYAAFEGGGEERGERRERRGDRPGGPRGPRRDAPARDRGRGPERRDRPDRGPRPGPGGPRGEGRPNRGPGGGPRGERRGGPRPDSRREDRPQLPPLPEVAVTLVPDQAGVESLARQIKLSGRAYPLFDIAGLVAQKPERYHLEFRVVRKDGTPVQRLFTCTLDNTLWLGEDEAARHALNRHFDKFYQAERTPTDAPKGNFTQVAVCGMSGITLGPSNWHGYQAALARLHAERFARVPFEVFKSRIKTVKDEAQVKAWVEEQSFKTEFVCLNVPEALRLPNREAVDKHFNETHRAAVVKEVETASLSGPAALGLRCPPLRDLARRLVDEQRRFPLKTVNILSQQFAGLGLQFFKRDKTVTYVAVARPRFLDTEATPVSDGVKRILDFINATPQCSRLKLFEALAPALAAAHAQASRPQAPAPAAPADETAGAATPPAAPVQPPPPPARSEADSAVLADLHWLIHEGHVLEFATGLMETAKRPSLKPQPLPKGHDAGYLPVFLGTQPPLAGA